MSAISIEEALASSKDGPRLSENMAAGAKRELRVLQVFSGLGMGGAETWLISLLKYFHEHNADLPVSVKFDVLLTGGEKAIFDDEAVALGARLFYLRFGRRNLVSFAREFRAILAKGNYDAIHDHQDYIAGLHFLFGAGRLPPTRIAHVHNPLLHIANYVTDPLRKLTSKAGKHLLRYFATDIMGTSVQVLREYGFEHEAYPTTNVGAAHCGFDLTRYQGDYESTHKELCSELGWDNSSKILLFVGRLEGAQGLHMGRLMTHKNPEFSLDVARECLARDDRVRLVMVGAGEEKKREFEEKVSAWKLNNQIRLLGVRSDVPRLMLGSDLLLFPSLAEGLGMVAVEAQAAGLRVIASDTTPRECVVVPDLIEFCALNATPAYWADRALRLINAPRRDSTSCNAAVSKSAFSIANSADLLLQLYGANSMSSAG
jgi:glycosyltransferase involved in cell wall biosynthesis